MCRSLLSPLRNSRADYNDRIPNLGSLPITLRTSLPPLANECYVEPLRIQRVRALCISIVVGYSQNCCLL
jgi:hypothetical protein